MNYLCIIRVCSSDGIKVDTSCNYFTTIVICMVSDNFSSSGGSKVFCFVLFVDFLSFLYVRVIYKFIILFSSKITLINLRKSSKILRSSQLFVYNKGNFLR